MIAMICLVLIGMKLIVQCHICGTKEKIECALNVGL